MLQQLLRVAFIDYIFILHSEQHATKKTNQNQNKCCWTTTTLLKYTITQSDVAGARRGRYLVLRKTALGKVVCGQDALSPTWSGPFQQGGRLERREQISTSTPLSFPCVHVNPHQSFLFALPLLF